MATNLFVIPIKKDKTATFKAFMRECLAQKQNEYKDLLRRYALNNIKLWVKTIDGKDYAIFTHDMDDNATELLKNWPTSTHPFDQWFNKHLQDCYEIDDASEMPTEIEFLGELDIRQ